MLSKQFINKTLKLKNKQRLASHVSQNALAIDKIKFSGKVEKTTNLTINVSYSIGGKDQKPIEVSEPIFEGEVSDEFEREYTI